MGKPSLGDFALKSVNQGTNLQETRIHWYWCSKITCASTLQVLQVAMKISLCSWFRKIWCTVMSLLPFRKGHQCVHTTCCKCSLIFEIIHVLLNKTSKSTPLIRGLQSTSIQTHIQTAHSDHSLPHPSLKMPSVLLLFIPAIVPSGVWLVPVELETSWDQV